MDQNGHAEKPIDRPGSSVNADSIAVFDRCVAYATLQVTKPYHIMK